MFSPRRNEWTWWKWSVSDDIYVISSKHDWSCYFTVFCVGKVSLLVCKIHPGVLRRDRTLHIDYETNATGCIQLVLFVHRQNHCWSLFSFLFLHACLSFYSSQWKWRLAASLTTCEKWTPTRWGRTTTAAAASLRYDVSDIFEFQVGLKIF